MTEEFETLLKGIRHGNRLLSGDISPVNRGFSPELGKFYLLGLELSDARHWMATSDYLTEQIRDEANYDAIAEKANELFGKYVVELNRDVPVGSIGFIHPVTGEKISFYA